MTTGKCRYCDEPASKHCEGACELHLRMASEHVLTDALAYCSEKLGMSAIPGTEKLIFECCSCGVYEACSVFRVDEYGLFELVEEGLSVMDIEKMGWRRINKQWYCKSCLAAE